MSIPKSRVALGRALAEAVHDEALPASVRQIVRSTREHLATLDVRIAECDHAIGAAGRDDPAARRLQELCGVGPTIADAAIATVGDARAFRNGRQFAAWLGLTPRQFSSGGVARLGAITRRGDSYLRTLLVLGARSALNSAVKCPPDKATRLQQWIVQLRARVGYHKALVAIATKYVRVIWALLARDENYDGKSLMALLGITLTRPLNRPPC